MVDFAPPPPPTEQHYQPSYAYDLLHMQRKLTGVVTVEIDVTGQLRTIYSAFKYFRKKFEYNLAVHQLLID
jgi:hypothetical protein